MNERFFKVLRDHLACHGGSFDYSGYMPKGRRPGKWTPEVEGGVRACSRGYHSCTPEQLGAWLRGGDEMFEVEYREPPIVQSDKVVGGQMRIVRRVEHGEVIGGVGFCDGDIERIESGLWLIRSGTVGAIEGGTVESIWGGTVESIEGGTVGAIRGGTVESIRGGTVESIRGGTVESIEGGTVGAIEGGTVESIEGGTVESIEGGTVESIRGGTVESIEGGTVFLPDSRYANPQILHLGERGIVIDRMGGGITIFSAIPVDVLAVDNA